MYMNDDLENLQKFNVTLKDTLKTFTAKAKDPFYNFDETYEKVLQGEFE